MGRKAKFNQVMKLNAVREYLEGKSSSHEIAMKYGCRHKAILFWVAQYESHGADVFQERQHNQAFTLEFKQLVVEEYQKGEIGLTPLAIKYNIRSEKQIRDWIKRYNGHKELTSSGTSGGIDVTKGRKTTYEERIEIVEDCLKNGQDYHTTAQKYKVSYQQVYSWVQKFNANGVAALQDNRGRGKALEDMNELERLAAENKLLKAKLERLEIEAELKKKVQEYRMRLESTARRKR